MSVRVCVKLDGREVGCRLAEPSDARLLLGHLQLLAAHNARLYSSGRAGWTEGAPFSIPYKPDDFADEVVFSDARVLELRGHGSCGELAAAYAGWWISAGIPAQVVLTRVAGNAYHVTSLARGTVYDPEVIGPPWH